ncbi:hypothetical protein [Micromonospora vulcania]|uniref:Uncharacterized protein n=1 Tax=Micromonospora vulcania TaxID=1441873 RepID=A0ABW1H3X4_9ACTN
MVGPYPHELRADGGSMLNPRGYRVIARSVVGSPVNSGSVRRSLSGRSIASTDAASGIIAGAASASMREAKEVGSNAAGDAADAARKAIPGPAGKIPLKPPHPRHNLDSIRPKNLSDMEKAKAAMARNPFLTEAAQARALDVFRHHKSYRG